MWVFVYILLANEELEIYIESPLIIVYEANIYQYLLLVRFWYKVILMWEAMHTWKPMCCRWKKSLAVSIPLLGHLRCQVINRYCLGGWLPETKQLFCPPWLVLKLLPANKRWFHIKKNQKQMISNWHYNRRKLCWWSSSSHEYTCSRWILMHNLEEAKFMCFK